MPFSHSLMAFFGSRRQRCVYLISALVVLPIIARNFMFDFNLTFENTGVYSAAFLQDKAIASQPDPQTPHLHNSQELNESWSPPPTPQPFWEPGECTFSQNQLTADFDHNSTFSELDIRNAASLLIADKLAIAHLNASGIFFVIPKAIDHHAKWCVLNMARTFAALWESGLHREIVGTDSLSVLMNFKAGEVNGTLGLRLPVLSYGKSRSSNDILYPRPYLITSLEQQVPPLKGPPEDRTKSAVFRGVLTNEIRARLHEFHKTNGDIVDADIVGVVEHDLLDDLGKGIELVPYMKIVTQYERFQYMINVDGWGCAERLPFLLRLNSVVLYHGATHTDPGECVEWYHDGLEPDRNFVKFSPDLSDLRERILWLRHNDDIAKQIVARANYFSNTLISLKCANWYMWEVLKRYRKIYRPDGHRTDGEQWIEGSSLFNRVLGLEQLQSLMDPPEQPKTQPQSHTETSEGLN
jgi:hypothetical protein